MRIPEVRERVRIEGRFGTYLVVWVDRETGTAEVIPLVEGDEVLSVTLSAIRPLDLETDTSTVN